MSRYLKVIWFAENHWTRYHATIGIDADETLCGMKRMGRILPSEKYDFSTYGLPILSCLNCRNALRKRYGYNDVQRVRIE